MNRRAFMGMSAAGLAGWAMRPAGGAGRFEPEPSQVAITSDIRTNIDEAMKIPRVASSAPGRYPGVVVKVNTGQTASAGAIDRRGAKRALDQGLMKLTGKSRPEDAWSEFVSPSDRIGIKVNPVARTLPTSRELTQAVIDGLQEAGVPRGQIAVWDRRLLDLIAQEFLTTARVAKGAQSAPDPTIRLYLDMAAKLGLGVSDRAKIDLREFAMA